MVLMQRRGSPEVKRKLAMGLIINCGMVCSDVGCMIKPFDSWIRNDEESLFEKKREEDVKRYLHDVSNQA